MSVHASQPPVLPTLASQPLPRHVRDLLQLVLKICTNALEGNVSLAVRELEQQIMRLSGQATDGATRERLVSALRSVEGTRSVIVESFLAALEAELALLQSPVVVRGQMTTRFRSAGEMTLVNDQEIEETSALTDAATRAELQNSLPLFLLGQRFGVLAGRPAFDSETLPIGPQALCRSIRRAVERNNMDTNVRLLMYRAFERQVMRDFSSLVELVNSDLARNGVLPNLQYVPVRGRRTEQNASVPRSSQLGDHGLKLAEVPASATRTADTAASGQRPASRKDARDLKSAAEVRAEQARQAAQLLLAMAATQGGALATDEGYSVLRQLLGGRRQLLGKLNSARGRDGQETPRAVSANDLQEVLRSLQNRPASPVMSHGRSTARNIGHLKQDMLALLRRVSPNQEAPSLAEEHNDAIDLVAMLYDNLGHEVKDGSTAAHLLTKLQVPIMRVALHDKTFFTRQDHPARQMLNSIAETGANWLSEDEADPALVGQLNSIVDRAVHEYRGDPGVFHNVHNELVSHLQTLSRKAEVAERRHVEAAQGKEKLTLAREHAAESVETIVKGHKLPRFTRTMLSQAWTDVMAITALRQGPDSPQWRQQLRVAERLMEIAQRPAKAPAEDSDQELLREIEDGLSKVGYQDSDVSAIARRLLNPNAADADDDASSRTELTLRLKAQARLGEDLSGKTGRRIPLTSTEQVALERLKEAPPGGMFEFTLPQGEQVKRRMAWFSKDTGAVLFVNHRGQKYTDQTLDSLARLIVKGQVRPLEEQRGALIDRAWENVLTALRSFAPPDEPGAPA